MDDGSDGFMPPRGPLNGLTKRRNYLVAARCHTGTHQLCVGINANEGLFWVLTQEEVRAHLKWESLPVTTCEDASCGPWLELRTVEVLETKVKAMNAELEALRAVENAALAYVPYPAKTFDERHAPLRVALVHALAGVVKVRTDAEKAKMTKGGV